MNQSKETNPPQYPIHADEVLRLTGKYPKERSEDPSMKTPAKRRMQLAIAAAIFKLKVEWGLTSWGVPGSRAHVFDREEIERKKKEKMQQR